MQERLMGSYVSQNRTSYASGSSSISENSRIFIGINERWFSPGDSEGISYIVENRGRLT